jgi:hypothetical protein
MAKLGTMTADRQTALVQCVLPEIFGDHFSRGEVAARNLGFESLVRLVRLAFCTIRVEEDNERPSDVMYSPDDRDRAERARSAAFNQLVETPGRATFDTLLCFAETADFPVPPDRLRVLARDRAAADSESTPWSADDVLPFEQTCQTAPTTTKDLQRVALLRLVDMQHDLLHADFRQGATLSALHGETAVQNWIADRLRLVQGRSYGVEREPHVAEEKEPDVRLRAKATDASLPIEIKVAESWSVEELKVAVAEQLCGRYLRARDARHGILLLVHQAARAKGWENRKTGALLDFSGVVAHLRTLAAQICGATSDGPQPEIAVLDVSSCAVSAEPSQPGLPKAPADTITRVNGRRQRMRRSQKAARRRR